MIFNILDNTTELCMTKYIIGEFFSTGGATLYKNHSAQTVLLNSLVQQVERWEFQNHFYYSLGTLPI